MSAPISAGGGQNGQMVNNMEKRIIRVGSRESALAVAQTWLVLHQIEAAHPEIDFELVTMKTTGDKILDRTLDKIGGKGLFVKELDRALRNGEVDITVHSLKDVPMEVPRDLPLLAFAKRGDPRDAVVLRQGLTALEPEDKSRCSHPGICKQAHWKHVPSLAVDGCWLAPRSAAAEAMPCWNNSFGRRSKW